MHRDDWLVTLGLIILGTGLFSGGFWLGYKAQKPVTPEVKGANVVIEKKVETLSVPGVSWIKAGESPSCPDTHPVKAKFDSYTGYFYTRDHKGYDKIKAMLCFASEDYAENTAGFLKKY